jgi:hypothetical protein
MEVRSFPALLSAVIQNKKTNVNINSTLTAFSWKSPEPTAVGAGRSAIAVHAVSRRWLSFFR